MRLHHKFSHAITQSTLTAVLLAAVHTRSSKRLQRAVHDISNGANPDNFIDEVDQEDAPKPKKKRKCGAKKDAVPTTADEEEAQPKKRLASKKKK